MTIKRVPNGSMVEMARISRGFSQKELAEKLNIDQGRISKIEQGLIGIKDDMLDTIASQLDYPNSFFYENINTLPASLVYYRKRKAINNFEIARITSNLFIKKFRIQKLLESLDLPSQIFYRDNEHVSPSDVARMVRIQWKIPNGRINNLVNILEAAGVLIFLIDNDDDKFDGQVLPDEGNLPIICINKNLSPDRERYTLAHELGHLIMHSTAPTFDVELAEKEADEFASELLMPADDVINHLFGGLTINKLADLKSYWKTSFASLIRRAHDLGVINKSKYTSLYVQISQLGYRKHEPDCGITFEMPKLIKSMVKLHLNELEYTKEELMEILKMNKSDLQDLFDLYNVEETTPPPFKIIRN
jgi:Zn-dependent peptidase ImmA (M78 family)/transcriptional regulator with XRE-family HTH domain